MPSSRPFRKIVSRTCLLRLLWGQWKNKTSLNFYRNDLHDSRRNWTDGKRLAFENLEGRLLLTTTLGLGDVAFTGVQVSGDDKISMVLLKEVTAGTVLTITDNAWSSASGGLTANEGSSVLTFNTTFPAGTQLNYDAARPLESRWANGSVTTHLVGVTSASFLLSNSGDNLFIYNGTTPPASATSTAWVAAFATNPFLLSGNVSSNLTYLPSVFTVGETAFTFGSSASNSNGVYNAGSFTGSASAIRTQVYNLTNWTLFTSAGGQSIPPNAVFTVTSNTNTPPSIVTNQGLTVRTSSTGNVISSARLNSSDAEQTAQQLVYRATTLPTSGSLRFNSVAVIANTTTFTQADINAGLFTYNSPSSPGSVSFGFSVSDGSLMASGQFAIQVVPNVLLNEIVVNPPSSLTTANRFQYIELRGTPNLPLTNVVVTMFDGNGSSAGRADYVASLTGRSLGPNGLLVIKSPTGGYASNASTAVFADPQFDTAAGGLLSKQTVSFYLGTTVSGIVQGHDYDAENNGSLELLPQDFTILDNVGWSDGGATDHVYGGVVLSQFEGTPDAASRFNRNNSIATAAWYNGDMQDAGNGPPQLFYNPVRRSSNLPINPIVASVTPGDVNFTAQPLTTVNTGLSLVLGANGSPISGSNLTATDLEHSSQELVYRITSLPATGLLKLNGINVVANTTTFTQADIDLERLTIDPGPTARETSFAFSVSNGVVVNTGIFLLGYRVAERSDLRIVSYNIASGGGSGAPRSGLGTILEAIGSEIVNGISRPIDVLALQEVASQAATTQLVVGLLNTAYNTLAYASGVLDGGSSGSGTLGIVYNTATVQFLNEVALGTVSSNGAPRQALRYRFRPVGTTGAQDFYMYNSHLKSADDSESAQRRLEQVQTIRNNADALGSGVNTIYIGDLNVYRSSEAAYQALLSAGNGQAFDPLNRPGNWSDNASFVSLHTQAPSETAAAGLVGGGLDDRFDFQLLTASFFDGVGLEYSPGSYRAFGNNGSVGLNQSVNLASSTALVGLANRLTVLNLLTTVSDHLPVVADYYFGSGSSNVAPTNVQLSNATIAETAAAGTTVGILSSVDSNVGDVHVYSLVNGGGSADNFRFALNGNRLLVGALAAFDGPRTYSLRIRTTDQNGLTFEKPLVITVTNVAPSLAVNVQALQGTVFTSLTNTGSWLDVPADTVTLTSTIGNVTKNSDGTWIWSYIPPAVVTSQFVTITASDGTNTSSVEFTLTTVATNPVLTITSGDRTYDRNSYTATASIVGSVSPAPAITYQYYSDSAGAFGIAVPSQAGTYYVRAFSEANSNNNAAVSAISAFTIHRAALIATATVSNKIFDNTTAATILSRSLSGLIGSDVVSISGGTAVFADAVVGTGKTVLVTGLIFGGASANNYTANTTLSTVADILARGLIQTRGVRYLGATGAGPNGANTSLATDKSALLPGQNSSFANYTNYSRGLNGIVVDIANLPASTSANGLLSSLQFAHWNGIAAGGFSTLPAAAVPTVTVLAGAGSGGAARIQIQFPDNAIQNTWLRVTVVGGLTTALTENEVFYFGNAIGDFNVGNTTGLGGRIRVNATDTGAVRSNQSTASNSASVTNIYDVNRDGRVNASDTGIVRSNQQTSGIIAHITTPSQSPPPVAPSRSGGDIATPPFPPPVLAKSDQGEAWQHRFTSNGSNERKTVTAELDTPTVAVSDFSNHLLGMQKNEALFAAKPLTSEGIGSEGISFDKLSTTSIRVGLLPKSDLRLEYLDDVFASWEGQV